MCITGKGIASTSLTILRDVHEAPITCTVPLLQNSSSSHTRPASGGLAVAVTAEADDAVGDAASAPARSDAL